MDGGGLGTPLNIVYIITNLIFFQLTLVLRNRNRRTVSWRQWLGQYCTAGVYFAILKYNQVNVLEFEVLRSFVFCVSVQRSWRTSRTERRQMFGLQAASSIRWSPSRLRSTAQTCSRSLPRWRVYHIVKKSMQCIGKESFRHFKRTSVSFI